MTEKKDRTASGWMRQPAPGSRRMRCGGEEEEAGGGGEGIEAAGFHSCGYVRLLQVG